MIELTAKHQWKSPVPTPAAGFAGPPALRLALPLAVLAVVALLGLVASAPAVGQSISPDRSNPLPYLLDIGDAFAQVRYSPGALDRASHVQQRFSLLAQDFKKWSNRSVPVSAVLLSRTDWEALDLAVPYGLPGHMANGEVALCAWGDQGTVSLWRALLGGEIPLLDGHPIYGTRVEASSLQLNDLLAQGVGARALLNGAGFSRVHPDVLNFTAHVIALAASNLHEKPALSTIQRVYSIVPPETSLGAPIGGGVWRERLAGERLYYNAAKVLIARRGVNKAPKALIKLLRHDGTSLTVRGVEFKFPEIRGMLTGGAPAVR